jgi:pimeloyl-ACP methyl ester carboxylesterase
MLALAYAAAYPASIASLILVGSGNFDLMARGEMQEILKLRMNDEIRERLDRTTQLPDEDERLKASTEAQLPLFAYDPLAPPEDEKVDAQAFRETWDDMLRLQADGTYPTAFASIKIPVLMVHGTFDPHPGALIQASLKSYMPQLEYRELEQCGHWPWLEKSATENFFSVIREWLGGQH